MRPNLRTGEVQRGPKTGKLADAARRHARRVTERAGSKRETRKALKRQRMRVALLFHKALLVLCLASGTGRRAAKVAWTEIAETRPKWTPWPKWHGHPKPKVVNPHPKPNTVVHPHPTLTPTNYALI